MEVSETLSTMAVILFIFAIIDTLIEVKFIWKLLVPVLMFVIAVLLERHPKVKNLDQKLKDKMFKRK